MLSTPLVADLVARLFAATIRPKAKPSVRFPEVIGHTTTITIPTRHGDTTATVYQPATGDQRRPVYVNVHGGGFVVGHREQDDPWCRFLAAHANVVVVNTDYVLAPHRRFPAPVEQIYDVLQWASSPERDWDGSELCVGGQSAGGNLAASASRLALENGGPRIKLQVLHYAPLDLVTRTRDKATPVGRAAVLRPWMGEVFDTAYIPDRGQRRDRLASPAWGSNGDDLTGIAPALIVTAGFDRLRDEAAAYARKLDAVCSLAEYHEVGGVDHGYNIMSDAPEALAATQRTYVLIADHVVRATAPGRS
jgi:acetyl esterase/lipase